MLHSVITRSFPEPNPAADRPWQPPFADAGPALRRIPPPAAAPAASPLFESMRGLDLFSHLRDEDLAQLSGWARERRFEKNDSLLLQNDPDPAQLFVILDGEAAVLWEDGAGEQALLSSLRPGDMAGALALFDRDAQPATVRAITPVRALALRRETLFASLRSHPEMALDLLAEMARRLRQCQRRIAGICNQPAPRRVAAAVLTLVEERGVRLKDVSGRPCLLVRRRPTQRRIAALAGTTRETVSRYLNRWEKAEWLSDRKGDLMIFDEPKLRRLAGEEPG